MRDWLAVAWHKFRTYFFPGDCVMSAVNGTPEGDDLVILTGTEAVVLLDEINRLQAAELELEGNAGPTVYCDYCDEVAAGLGVDKDRQLVPVCNGHRGTAERLFPIPPKWERK